MPKPPAEKAGGVHTPAPAAAPIAALAPAAAPAHHAPTPAAPRDAYTGQGGTYERDSATGERRRTSPAPTTTPETQP